MFGKLKIGNSMKIENWKLKIILISLSFAFWVSGISASKVSAQGLSLGIYPPLLEVTIQPGKSITQVYKLSNGGETDLAMTSLIVPFEPSDEFGNIKLLSESGSVSFRSNSVPFRNWFSFQNADLALGQKFILKSGKTQEIVLKIGVPKDAKEDDYYLTLLFETLPAQAGTAPAEALGGGGSTAQTQAKIGANILLTVSQTGEPLRQAEILEFRIKNNKFRIVDSFDKAEFLLRVKNTGKAFFKPIGTITITGWFGQKYILDLLPENVLVNSIRQIQCQMDDRVTPCQLPEKFLLGPYRARMEFGLDKVSDDYTAETIFWAIPAKLILALLTTIFILFIIKNRLKLPY